MQALPDTVGADAPPATRAVSGVRSKVATKAGGAEVGEVDQAPASNRRGRYPRGTRAEALDKIFETAERDGEGFRTGALGRPRVGKTYHLKEVVDAAVARGIADVALIHDCKREDVQYDGIVRASVADLAARPLAEDDPPVVVIHAQPAASVDEVSSFALLRARNGKLRSVVLIDELYQGLKARQVWDVPSGAKSATAEVLREGSSQGVSMMWTTQIPQALPTECCDLSETMAIFALRGRSLSYAMKVFDLPDEARGVIQSLDRGEFILLTADDGWDGKIYGPK